MDFGLPSAALPIGGSVDDKFQISNFKFQISNLRFEI
jgi:hypothetical protein